MLSNDHSSTTDDRDETLDERLDRNWDELLQELRITQTGIQLLSGFLLTLAFTDVFARLDGVRKDLYLVLVILAALAVGANMTPVLLHRRVFRQHAKDRVVAVAHALSQVVIAAVAVLFAGTATLIFSLLIGWVGAVVLAVCLSCALVFMLGVLAWRLARMASSAKEPA